MAIFTLTNDEERRFENFISQAEQLTARVEELDKDDAEELRKFTARFEKKRRDFFDAERRLNIGIIGQVKAGKSSFLNTLLFDGMSVLPKASTPKTAALTKIEYADENAMEIEYYGEDDWDVIKDNAAIDKDGEEYESARDLVKMAGDSGIDVQALIAAGKERIEFANYDDLMDRLNDYVGENGKYTALVKAVVLYVNNPLFQELSIVDTPGLNDPIVSRTLRTKEFMEVCDVVFFLTPCSAFLDKSDWTLLSTQLPQKGVKRLILVGSKFDSGLRDVLCKSDPEDIFGHDPNMADTIPGAIELVQTKLTARAREKVTEYVKRLTERGTNEEIINIIGNCRQPLFVSAMAQNIIGRELNDLDETECGVYNALAEFSDNLSAELPKVGNFAAVQAIQDEVVTEKETILTEKCAGFIPTAREELKGMVSDFREKARSHIAILSGNDRKQLAELKRDIQSQINKINADVQTTVGEWLAKVETQKIAGTRALRNAAKESQTLEERTATETKHGSTTVSDSKWYNPFSWGSSHTEHYTYEESYTYVAASDAADNIRRFVKDSETNIERAFSEAVSHQEMKRRLLSLAAENFDLSDESYDDAMVRLMVQEQINKVEFPVIRVDCSNAVNSIAAKFSGRLRDGSDQNALRNALANAVDTAYEALMNGFEKSASAFKVALSEIGDGLQKSLLRDINEKFDKILEELDDKDANIARLNTYINELDKVIKGDMV